MLIDDPEAVDEVSAAIRGVAGPTVNVTDWRQRNETFFTVLEVERNVMFIILSLIVLVAALNIISGLIMLVKDKSRDIAILRTMGVTRASVLRIFIMTGAAVGIAGTAAGVILGIVIALNVDSIRQFFSWLSETQLFNPELYFLSKLPAKIDPSEVMLVVCMALVLTFFASIIGVAAGAVQGYFGGWTDLLFQRFIEIWTSVPQLYLLIIIAAVIEPSFWILLGILLAFSWVALVGVVRAEFLRARNFEYVTAARALGLSNLKIIFKHLLPNAMVATLTFMPFILNGSISTLTSLDFLGVGLPAGSPSLGELLAQGKDNLQAPWLGLTAFFVIAIMLSLLIFIGEAVRDALDPRKSFG